uniref:Uncharacterized protein n=1 Tax=Mus spicilegus TaxID=10103 RepID=A0A8C6MRU4_MUSSI
MMRLSHSGSSDCGSGCGSSMVREPRRRAHSDGRASDRARVNDLRARHWSSAARPGARATHARSLTAQTSRRDRPLAHRVCPAPRHLSRPRPPIAHRTLSDLCEHQSQRSWAPARPAGREERE